MTPDELHAKLAKTESGVLAAFLVRLAAEDDALRERIEALAQRADPAALAACLERRLKRFRSGRTFISYRESGELACELDGWLEDVGTHLLEADPATAWKLLDRFIRADEHILGRADDSSGLIGDAFRRACGLWHRAAAALPADPAWVERVYELHAGNGYGARDAILDEAATRLSELELRRLARIYEQDARSAPTNDRGSRALTAAAAMGQVACALGDAALYERSVTIRSPRPNGLQAAEIAEQYLRFGPVERAIEWLTRSDAAASEHHASKRLDLLARAYEKLGDRQALLDVRRRLHESSLSAELFSAYAELLSPDQRDAARRQALERAERSDSPVTAGFFLLDLGADERAAALVLRLREHLSGAFYAHLLSLAQRLEKAGHPLPAVACYRALTDQILGEGRSKAYRHARRYVDRLSALDRSVDDYRDLPTHPQYLAHLRERHGRKFSFWRLFEESASSRDTD
jgi:hypothetical protein